MAKILLLGSVAKDRIIFLRTPIREGAHLEGQELGDRIGGGAANTGGALAHAGHHVLPVSTVGDDDTGEWILGQLVENRLDLSLIERAEGSSTHSLVCIDPAGERTIINLTRSHEQEPPSRILDTPADCLFVRSRDPSLAPLLEKKTRDCLVVAHIPPCKPGTRPAHVLIASESDLGNDLLGAPFTRWQQIAGEQLRWVVITHGPKGATAFSADEQVSAPVPKVEATDSTGAGDAFAAGLVHGLVTGQEMHRALKTGCAWGAEAVRWESSILPREAVGELLAP